jgi:hypothetical protein
MWGTYQRHYGPQGDPLILVAQGTSRDLNPTLPQAAVDRALERDEAVAKAEYHPRHLILSTPLLCRPAMAHASIRRAAAPIR